MSTVHDRQEMAEMPDDDERDELDELIAEEAQADPTFMARFETALRQRLEARERGEDPNDIPWDDEEEADEQDTSAPSTALPH